MLVEKAMATHSNTLAWKIPWTEEPGRLQPMGLRSVGHDWVTSLSLFTFVHWKRKWQPTPLYLPGESQGRGSLVGCRRTRLKRLSSSSSSFKCAAKWFSHTYTYIAHSVAKSQTQLSDFTSFFYTYGGVSGKEPTCQCRRHKRSEFYPWVGKIP